LDAMIPAHKALKAVLETGSSRLEVAKVTANAAEEGAKYTATLLAKRGRASYLGERVLGHIDPGIYSSN